METEKIHKLVGKRPFTVTDLIKVLSRFNKNAEVHFGILDGNNTDCGQDENLIFEATYRSREAEMDDDYDVIILTEGKVKH